MRKTIEILGLVALVAMTATGQQRPPAKAAAPAPAAQAPAPMQASRVATAATAPHEQEMYCSGMVTTDPISHDTYLISGEESTYKVTFAGQSDLVYINKGSSQGVQVGDEFLIMRPIKDAWKYQWFTYQNKLRKAMGQQWADAGRVKVILTQSDVSTARVTVSCGVMLRGDYAMKFTPRASPQYKTAAFEAFAPASGKTSAMVVSSREFETAMNGTGDIVYVNLGSGQGVKVGDYFRMFRYQGTTHETAYQERGREYKAWNWGKTPPPAKWDWKNLPREILGEGIVLNVSANSATVLITYSRREIYLGDYVEIE
ncbi:MAG: hypothetical protein HY046_10425 [Acidobacteria bacterium]|nr:hypothetical protein [Acidobacteriota bacterium]